MHLYWEDVQVFLSQKNHQEDFQKMWIQHPDFLQVVADSWSNKVDDDPSFYLYAKIEEVRIIS